jgi:histone H2A
MLPAEILELSGNACKDNKRFRITPRHVLLAIGNDEELQKVDVLPTFSYSYILVSK